MEIKMNIEKASLSYAELREKFKKGLRNGNWRKLNRKEKALYRAAMAYTKLRKKGEMAMDIVNRMLVEKLLGLIERLKETKGKRILKRGLKKAVEESLMSKDDAIRTLDEMIGVGFRISTRIYAKFLEDVKEIKRE
ncbi:MAG: hypothetical protein H8D26_03735 [Methanomicrobia archaeon]|nr:hypothetical protein [Methanomicrobia archaeon]